MTTSESILILTGDKKASVMLENSILGTAGYQVTTLNECQAAEEFLRSNLPDVLFVGERMDDGDGLSLVSRLLEQYPQLPVIFIPQKHTPELEISAFRQGVRDYLTPGMKAEDILALVKRTIQHHRRVKEWAIYYAKRNTKSLQKRVLALEALQRIGKTVTGLLDLDSVLKTVVDSAVELTEAEEGSLLLLDPATGELYMRAARNFNDEYVRTFRLPIRDTLPGKVLRSGKPLLINEQTPQKIKTAYLVHTLIYVPLQIQGRTLGVLGVDNRQGGRTFTDEHVALLSAMAGFAAVAIENASLYSKTEVERHKLETILCKVEDGVLVVDHDNRIVIMNNTLQTALNLEPGDFAGRPVADVINHPDLLELLSSEKRTQPTRGEISLEDGRVFNAQMTPISEVGIAITLQDITHLKELDRIKSEFVSTVSHDLRSPLTAILGYVELIDRVGPVNDTQREFIHRVQISVHNITSLINDLLDLGRIEAGFDVQKELVPMATIIHYAIESFSNRIKEKALIVESNVPENLPSVLGNPARLRQMVSNLIGNAIKYTPTGGHVSIRAISEDGQIIFQVIDNGPGIPPSDQPYIFDKFYRASNVNADIQGTGLGLAIVKSIIENHQGRIWVKSSLGVGSVFTVVLPIAHEIA